MPFRDCGKTAVIFRGAKQRSSERLEQAKSKFPELCDWGWPEVGPEAEKASLEFQATRFKRAQRPSNWASTINKVCKLYPATQASAACRTFNREELESQIRFDLWNSINPKGSPGVPLAALGKENAQVRESYESLIVGAVLERMILLGSRDLSGYSPEELVLIGACDPVRLFVKQEPHKISKIVSKRFRLISSVSLIDQLVERVLFGVQNRKEISLWEHIPSKPGIGLTDEMTRNVFQSARLASGIGPLAEADISGWDWSVQDWELEADLEIRVKLARGLHSCTVQAMRNRILALSSSVFSFSDGEMRAQVYRGLMKSGSYLTSSTNSRCRVFDHYVLTNNELTWLMAMGDDSVEVDIARDGKTGAQLYESLGKTVGMYNLCPVKDDAVESFELLSPVQ